MIGLFQRLEIHPHCGIQLFIFQRRCDLSGSNFNGRAFFFDSNFNKEVEECEELDSWPESIKVSFRFSTEVFLWED
jgi:hypothetical protein